MSAVPLRDDRANLNGVYAMLALGCLAATVSLVLGIWLPFTRGSETALAVSMLIGALMLVVIATRFGHTGGNLFDPLLLFTAVFFFYFVVHAIWVVGHPVWANHNILHPFRDTLARSQAFFGLAYVALLCAYSLPQRQRAEAPRKSGSFNLLAVSPIAIAAMFVAGMASNAIAASHHGYSRAIADAYKATGNILVFRTFGYLALVAFLIGLAQVMRMEKGEGRPFKFFVYGVMLPVQVGWAFAVGAKMEVLFVVFSWAAVSNYWQHFIRLRTMLVVFVFFVFIVSPVIQASRRDYRQGQATNLQDIRQTFVGIPDRLKVLGRPSILYSGFEIIQRRTNGSESLALAVKYTPELQDFQHGSPWKAIPLSPIPRFLWPNKPHITQGKNFSLVYGGQYSGLGLTLGPTIPGDLYMNFGIAGMLGGFFLFGLFLRFLTRLASSPNREFSVLMLVTLMIPFMLMEQDVGTAVMTALLRALVVIGALFAITRFASISQRRVPLAASPRTSLLSR